MPPLPAHDIAGYVTAFCYDTFSSDEDMAVILDRYHTPDCIHYVDGRVISREGYLTTVNRRRKKVRSYSLEIREALVSGHLAAVRYALRTKYGWFNLAAEAYTFGELAADGRLCRTVSSMRMLSAGRGGAGLASAAGLGSSL